MKIIRRIMGIVFSVSLIITVIISSVDIAVYADFGFYEKEYKKYNVNAPGTIVDMDMDELMKVTKEMMSYLRGNRDNLVVYAEIDGEDREFFNDIEKFHMADVRKLFVAAIILRRVCIIIMLLSAGVLIFLNENVIKTLSRAVMWSTGIFNILAGILTGIIAMDFSAAFIKFHEIFFTNDMWLLDPDTDRLINIVPEEFFSDTAVRIGIVYLIINLFNFTIAFFLYRGTIKKANGKNKKNTLTHDGGTHEQG